MALPSARLIAFSMSRNRYNHLSWSSCVGWTFSVSSACLNFDPGLEAMWSSSESYSQAPLARRQSAAHFHPAHATLTILAY